MGNSVNILVVGSELDQHVTVVQFDLGATLGEHHIVSIDSAIVHDHCDNLLIDRIVRLGAGGEQSHCQQRENQKR